jgi:putative ABC transport system permease protein
MWRLAVRDLVWRRRRFLIAIAATSLVFAITLLLAGVSNSVDGEPRRVTNMIGADRWVVTAGTSGPFTTTKLVPEDVVRAVAASPGVTSAEPVIIGRAVTKAHGEQTDLNVIGVKPSGAAAPRLASGTGITGDGQVVADEQLGHHVGDTIMVDDLPLRVVGVAKNVSYNFGLATVVMSAHDAQQVSFGGMPFVSAVAVRGVPASLPAGFDALDNGRVASDLHRPIEKGLGTITFLSILLWIVAAGIVGSIVYLTALERTRDFAVLKATGAATRDLLLSLAIEAIVLSVASALVAVVLSRLLQPAFPIAVDVRATTYVGLFVVAAVVAMVASALGLRRTVTVDPALAFGGA